MSDEIDRETTTKKVTPISNTPVNGYKVSEQHTSKVSNDSSTNGVVIGVLLILVVGIGAAVYFLNSRPVPTQILVPNATDTVKENKSTVIERNNTTTKEVVPAAPQPTPTVEINLPRVTITQPAATVAPAPRATVTLQPQVVTPTPTVKATTQPQAATPAPTSGAAN